MKTVFPHFENVKPLGRAMLSEQGAWLCYSASGIAFYFRGKALQVTVHGDDRCEEKGMEGNYARVQVRMDGKTIADFLMDKKEKRRILLQSSEVEEHRFDILKVSESAMSTCAVAAIHMDDDGEIRPAENQQHLIEFAGDSITCGYGIDDETAQHNFRTDTEDATGGYAFLACQKLHADHSLVSLSGYGIISGYTDNGQRKPEQRLPLFYEKAGFCYGSFKGVFPQDVTWDFSKRQPELVVINLGTNDDSYTQDHQALQLEYCREYQAFIKTVRANNPKAKILCILGMMGERLNPLVEKAVAAYRAETGDENIDYAPFTEQLAQDGRAADWHPSRLTHEKNAEKLTAIIQKIMQW